MEDTKRNRFASTGVRSDSKHGIHNDSLMGVLLKAVHDSRHFKSTGSNEHNRSLVEVERQAHGLCSEPIMAACYDCVLICVPLVIVEQLSELREHPERRTKRQKD